MKIKKHLGFFIALFLMLITISAYADTLVIDGTDRGDKTLKAKWKANTYTITYNTDGGTLPSTAPKNFNVESAAFVIPQPTKTGYVFTGWTGSNGTTPIISVTVQKGTCANLFYTAHWTKVTTIDAGNIGTYSAGDTTVSSSVDPNTGIITVTQKGGSTGWGQGVIADRSDTAFAWEQTYYMTFYVNTPREETIRLDTNAYYIDDKSGNDEYGSTAFYVDGQPQAGNNTTISANTWHSVTFAMTNNNSTRNPNHRTLVSYSTVGFNLSDKPDLTYQVKGLNVYVR